MKEDEFRLVGITIGRLTSNGNHIREEIKMKEVIILDRSSSIVHPGEIPIDIPVFAKRNGVLRGMIVREEEGWILRIGGTGGASGHHSTLEECIKSCLQYEYRFFIN